MSSSLTLKVTSALSRDGVSCEASNPHGNALHVFHFGSGEELGGGGGGCAQDPGGGTDRAPLADPLLLRPVPAVAPQTSQAGVAVMAVAVSVGLLLLVVAVFYCMRRKGRPGCCRQGEKGAP